MGNCLSKGQTSSTTPNVPREKAVTSDVSEKSASVPKQTSASTTPEVNDEKDESTPAEAEKDTKPVASEETTKIETAATEAKAGPESTQAPTTTTENGQATPSSPIADFDFGLATKSLANGDGQEKSTEPAEDGAEAPKDSTATPLLTNLVTSLPPSTEKEELKTATSQPSTVSPTVLSPQNTIDATETKQTSPPTSAVAGDSPTQDGSKKTESKFNEVTEDPSELKVGATAANTKPVARSSTAPQQSTPVPPVTEKATKRQSRISRMFSTNSKRQSQKTNPTPIKRETLPTIPRSPIREKAAPLEVTPETKRPETGGSNKSDLASPNLEGRKFKEDGDNDSLFCY